MRLGGVGVNGAPTDDSLRLTAEGDYGDDDVGGSFEQGYSPDDREFYHIPGAGFGAELPFRECRDGNGVEARATLSPSVAPRRLPLTLAPELHDPHRCYRRP